MILTIPCLSACSDSGDVSTLKKTYYHWQTELAPDSTARRLLQGHDRLYVKAFDVAWEDGAARPTAEIQLVDTVGLPLLIPVIFITNEVIRNTASEDIPALADDISSLTARLLPAGYDELQLDCDWTALTRVPYFALLEAMRMGNPGRQITCTIRLHQYRDRDLQGIPPVERATLMAYNTGDVAEWETENSIIDSTVVKNYLADQPPYPIDLDLAVAAYDWLVVFRRGKLVQLINEPNLVALADTATFIPSALNRYRVDSATYLNGTYLYRGDMLRHEIAASDRVDSQATKIREQIGSFPGQRLMVYRLGSRSGS